MWRLVLRGFLCMSLCGILSSCSLFSYLTSPKSTRESYDQYVLDAKKEGFEPKDFGEDWGHYDLERQRELRRSLSHSAAADAAQDASRNLASSVKPPKPGVPQIHVQEKAKPKPKADPAHKPHIN